MCILTCDESWAHHCTPETKRSSMEWCSKNKTTLEKVRHVVSQLSLGIVKLFCTLIFLLNQRTMNVAHSLARLESLLVQKVQDSDLQHLASSGYYQASQCWCYTSNIGRTSLNSFEPTPLQSRFITLWFSFVWTPQKRLKSENKFFYDKQMQYAIVVLGEWFAEEVTWRLLNMLWRSAVKIR